MPGFHRFLLVDDVAENRFLVSKALLKSFPDAVVLECQDSSTAISLLRHDQCDVAVVHRTRDLDGVTFIDLIRRCCPRASTVLISEESPLPDPDRIGATQVIGWDTWQMVGPVCAHIIAQAAERADVGADRT
jgi:CheY-like chemotaxis protein